MSHYCAGGSDAATTRSKIFCTIYDLITELVPTDEMNYINIAGIKHGEETDLQKILPHRDEIIREFKAAVKSCELYKTSLPVNVSRKGNILLSNPQDTRALMVFLRAAARLEGAAILCDVSTGRKYRF